jgi:uncharacterized protein YifE (UPF0438 family)
MILIERWVNGSQNFIVGRALYNRFGSDDALKTLFAKGESAFAKEKLHHALVKIKESGKRTPARADVHAFIAMPKGTDAVLQSIEKEWKPLYQRMNLLRHKLDQFSTANSPSVQGMCKPICKEILELEQQCMALWKKRDYYEEHGQLPEVKEEEFVMPEDPVALGKMIETLKKNIRRNKKKAKDEPSNPLYPALVKKYEDQLQKINSGQ